jgi:hypothetical protein
MAHSRTAERLVGSLAAIVIAATLAGCGPGDPQPGNTVSPTAPPTTSSSTTPGQETDVRTRLAAALRDSSPTKAKLVERPDTKLTETSTPWLTDWQVIDVLNLAPPHPQRFFAALSADGRATVLTGHPDAFSAVTSGATLKVDSAVVAESVAQVFLDSTQDFVKASYRVGEVDDIQWLPKPSTAQEQEKAKVRKEFKDKVTPAKAKKSGDGWTVTVWMVYDHRLDRHTVTITADGAVSDQVAHAYETLPVADSR